MLSLRVAISDAICCSAAALLAAGCLAGPDTTQALRLELDELRVGLEVESDLVVAPGEHLEPAPDGAAVLRVSGRRGLELDLRGVVLRGQDPGADPDRARGVALELVDCEDVVVRGGTFTGYRVGVRLENCRRVRLEGVTVEGGYAERLRSGPNEPDPDDQLELAPLDGARWLSRYGAGIALVDCVEVAVDGCAVRRGQNGVLLVRSLGCSVFDGELAWLSGWGVALWNSDECSVSRNRFTACVRGPLSGPRADGLGSAAILVSGRAARGVFAFNSAVDCGAGALAVPGAVPGAVAEDCLWYGNHLAPANGPGLALTGGRGDRVVQNRFHGAGLALTDATAPELYANRIEGARGAGLRLVGGRDGLLAENHVAGCDQGVVLLGGPDGPRGGGALLENELTGCGLDVVLEGVRALEVGGNRFADSPGGLDASGLETGHGEDPRALWAWLAGTGHPPASGRAADAELAHPGVGARSRLRQLRFEGPPETPGHASVAVDLARGRALHTGTFGPRPAATPGSAAPVGGLLAGRGFQASWFRFDAASDPRSDLDAWRALRFDPVERGAIDSWIDPWGDPARRRRIGPTGFGLVARGLFQVTRPGRHHLDVTSDDGVRILIDGVAVWEDWSWHPARTERVELELEPGEHAMVVEYFQLDGAAELALSLDAAPAP